MKFLSNDFTSKRENGRHIFLLTDDIQNREIRFDIDGIETEKIKPSSNDEMKINNKIVAFLAE